MHRGRWIVSPISWHALDRPPAGRARERKEWQRSRESKRPAPRAGPTIPARTERRWQVPPDYAAGYRESSISTLQKEDWEPADRIPPEPTEGAIPRFASRPASSDACAGYERYSEKDNLRLLRYR